MYPNAKFQREANFVRRVGWTRAPTAMCDVEQVWFVDGLNDFWNLSNVSENEFSITKRSFMISILVLTIKASMEQTLYE